MGKKKEERLQVRGGEAKKRKRFRFTETVC